MRASVVLIAFAVAACGPTAEEESAREQAVEEVRAGLEPPPEQLVLDPIRYREIERYDLFGAGCAFVPEGGGLAAVALAMADEGYLIRGGELLRFVADVGSEELPYLARQTYTGREYSFTLDLDRETGEQSGAETSDYAARLTVRDARENTVYSVEGLAQCGA